ncbi:hypothetical protein QQS45_08490 [Alteriqipengyuania flavescens]|uniref:hypothetical protein n=1 Tax=Alteriqipengyuania flavescens TaxID=3053610 RepID=UPI0025B3FBE9|nr:hypothetical protein [Alteriqipengyuania flavescens]WJY17685.1 hypothetical protein QQW98_08485 [Alteriqipengyuania flavescens]WJY23628.1 hypothetical protein QQS45_08490 [Alteriqipengyuania flavescens]
MTNFEETGRRMRIETCTGKTWIEAYEQQVESTDAPHLKVGDVTWSYAGNDCGGGLPINEGADKAEAFLRRYIGRERVRFSRVGFA